MKLDLEIMTESEVSSFEEGTNNRQQFWVQFNSRIHGEDDGSETTLPIA